MSIQRKTSSSKQKKTSTIRSNWPVAYRWAAMGTLVAYSAVGSKTINTAWAQDLPRKSAAHRAEPASLAVDELRRFDIPEGPLGALLPEFERVTGWSIRLAKDGIRRLVSPGVSGNYSAGQALEKLLADTGVIYRLTGPATVTLDLQSVAATVEVTASADAFAGVSPKYSEPLVDTPQTIATVPQQVLSDQAVATLRDALRNVAGISLAAGEGGAQGDNLTIRGFAARGDLFIDGMRDFGSYYRDPFNTQEVEVLQGPSSVTFGRGSTGGVVNQSTKTAGATRFLSADLTVGTDRTRRIALDVDRPVQLFGSRAALRLNVMGHESGVAGREAAQNRRFGVAPSLALGIGSATRWSFDYFHQNANDVPDYGIPWLFNGPAPAPRDNYYGFKNGNFLRTYDDIGTARVEHDFNSHFTLRDQARYASYVRDALITEALIPAGVTPATPLNTMAVTRHEIGVNSTETYLGNQLDATAEFATGFVRHNVIGGMEAGRETSAPTRPTWIAVPSTNLLNPDPDQTLSGTATITSKVHTTALSTAAYVLDTVKFGQHWALSGGFRWDRFDTSYSQTVAPASAFSRVDHMPSWRAAVVYKPVQAGSIYFDAGTSFNPSAESLSLTAGTVNLPPEKNRTLEFGSKWELSRSRLSFTAALFQTEKLNAREPDPANSLLSVLAGTQIVRGGQLEVRGRLTHRSELMGSYANLDATVASSNYYPASVGARLANVPRHTLNVWNVNHLPWHLELGIGTNYVSSRTASSTVPLDPFTGLVKEVPGYWVFSAMAKHRLTEHLDLQLNVNNIANRTYYDQLHPAHIILGPGRSALVGLKFRF